MAKLSDTEIKDKLKPIEDKIKTRFANKKVGVLRTDIQQALDTIYNQGLSPDKKIEILKAMVGRTGVKKISIRTLLTPRDEVEEVDNTYAFVKDIYSYKGVIEKEK